MSDDGSELFGFAVLIVPYWGHCRIGVQMPRKLKTFWASDLDHSRSSDPGHDDWRCLTARHWTHLEKLV